MPQERKLAAIMFTDIVGYTALMGSDEKKAFELLRRNRNIQKPIISKYKGKWLKEMGDGILASFDSASDAVRCAGEIQHKAVTEGIGLRIGIHLGEVVFEDNDVLGDGVNIASRLEEIAEAGSIYISGAIYKNVKNKEGITTEFLGDKTFRNVDEPVRVYKAHCGIMEETKRAINENPSSKKPTYIIGGVLIFIIVAVLIWLIYPREQSIGNKEIEKSIAVIPFWNDSPDPDNEYFCRGMEEEIRTYLSNISNLQVKPRLSVEKFRQNTEKDLNTIGKELGVLFVVEGSVRKIGNDIRLTVQLVDTKTSKNIWNDTYDGNYTEQLLTFQTNTAKQIALSLNTVIMPGEERDIDRLLTSDIKAYDLMIQGRYEVLRYWDTREIKYLQLANKLIDEAMEIDPQFVEAIAIKGFIYMANRDFDAAYRIAKDLLKNDPESALAYQAFGEYYRFTGNEREAIKNYELTLKYIKEGGYINKSQIEQWLSELYCDYINDYQKGFIYIQKSINNSDTITQGQLGTLGNIFVGLGSYEKANEYSQEMLKGEGFSKCWGISNINFSQIAMGNSDQSISFLDSICEFSICDIMCTRFLFWDFAITDQFDQALKYFEIYSTNQQSMFAWDSILLAYTYKGLHKDKEANSILNNRLISLGEELSYSDDWFTYIRLSMVHALLLEKELSMEYLSSAIDRGLKLGWHDFLPICPIYKNFWDDLEFKALVRKAQEERATKRKQVEEMIERGEINL